ncbi:glycosyltransferase family 2 protein [Sphingomonas sp. RP10(2022)]|uniref:Glycosyltransferase family 2 protein n=1 Tax=Sphingomonas liriopis TaxID=2949094 RepID=A0A9X2HVN4_9SPHN|nr:glycosyltransferase family A protein [Sphingomonas liriopis]MCP3733565.1 glycosyltransferase family 2 protein [Sphingomonas liriopis]
MYLITDQDRFTPTDAGASRAARRTGRGPAPLWTVLIPFFNERDFLAQTIASLAAQSVPLTMILVDNGSTDGSADVARAAIEAHGVDALVITETTPGKVSALRTGLGWVRTRYVATCDADTLYPPHYLAEAQRLLAHDGCVVAGAYFVDPGADQAALDAEARRILTGARLLPRQCHAGGAGQCFDVAALRAVGGFDAAIWGYILEDHEVIHRTMTQGTMLYSRDLWCMPSPRERDRASIRWTLFERLVYAATAPWAGSWFFYRFLARRLQRRRLMSVQMRERAFQTATVPQATSERPAYASSHPVR